MTRERPTFEGPRAKAIKPLFTRMKRRSPLPLEPKRILVCGDRKWTNRTALERIVLSFNPVVIISGHAEGADKLGEGVAKRHQIDLLVFPADWNKFGRAAGPIRNAQMLREGQPDLVLAFHDSIAASKGTKNMLQLAKRAGVPYVLFGADGKPRDWPEPTAAERAARPRKGKNLQLPLGDKS